MKKKTLIIKKKIKVISFPTKIIKTINIENNVVVLLEGISEYNSQIKSNICLYSLSGNKIWEAELPKEMPYSAYQPEYYDNVSFENDELMAWSFLWFCILDIKTGEIKTLYPNK